MFERFGFAKFMAALLTVLALVGIGLGFLYIFMMTGRYGAMALAQSIPVILGSSVILMVAQLVRAQIATAEQTADMKAQLRELVDLTKQLRK